MQIRVSPIVGKALKVFAKKNGRSASKEAERIIQAVVLFKPSTK